MEALELEIRVPLRSFDVEVGLDVPPGVLAIAGPSGAGKSTILRAIAGLTRPAGGRIALGSTTWFDRGRNLHLEPERRSVGLVFQDYALFPHLNVAQNVAFGTREPVGEFLRRFKIDHLARARPSELSGGERQRVALARALARRPRVVLLDEPLAALDRRTRESVRGELAEILRTLALPTVIVSHDFEDAATLADRVAIVVDGRIVQIGSPQQLVDDPATSFVASFTGSNLLLGHARPLADDLSEVVLESGVGVRIASRADGPVALVLAPWDIGVARQHAPERGTNQLALAVSAIVPMGNRARIATGTLTAEVTASELRELDLEPGAPIVMSFSQAAARLVPRAVSESRA